MKSGAVEINVQVVFTIRIRNFYASAREITIDKSGDGQRRIRSSSTGKTVVFMPTLEIIQ